MGEYRFANNKQHGFSHVTVNERTFTVRMMGVDWATNQSTELYKIKVYNYDALDRNDVKVVLE